MRSRCIFTAIIIMLTLCVACSVTPTKQLTPLETLKAYADAFKKKDITAMKLLLSAETIKMHEEQAKSLGLTTDDIVKRETLFTENQRAVDFRNQVVEDKTASIEMKDAVGIWNTVRFVKEDGAWKIDRKSMATRIEQDVEQKQNELDRLINESRQN